MTNAVLFPEIGFINYRLGNLSGGYAFNSPASLEFTLPALNLPIGEALVVKLGAVTLSPGKAVMASVASAVVESPLFGGLSGTISNFQIKRTGFTLGSLTLNAAGTLSVGNYLTVSGVTLTATNFAVDRTATPVVSGTIAVSVGSLSLFPNGNYLTTTATGLVASYELANAAASGRLTVTVGSLKLGLGEALEITASTVVLSPGAASVLATIGSATLSSPQFSGLGTVALSGLELRRDGFGIASASLTVAGTSGLGDALGQILKFDSVTVAVTNFVLNYGTTNSQHTMAEVFAVRKADSLTMPRLS